VPGHFCDSFTRVSEANLEIVRNSPPPPELNNVDYKDNIYNPE
jgi:hypothetical protein